MAAPPVVPIGRHQLVRCVCGRIIRQCRCIGPKAETVVGPCTHDDGPPTNGGRHTRIAPTLVRLPDEEAA